jgi:hypothetical protein
MKQREGGSSLVSNMENRITENLANTESRATENSANMESRITKNLANTESQIMENSANMENWVMQGLGGKKPEDGKGVSPSKRPAPRSCPRGITKTQKHRLQKMHQTELAKTKE